MTAEENELRVLLERAVPQLPAPAQRLERVRERVRRRRRRRVAGISAAVVAAVATAGLLLPGGPPAGRSAAEPGRAPASAGVPGTGTATGPAGTATVPAGATPTVSATDTVTSPTSPTYPPLRLSRFADLPLTLRLPDGWDVREAQGTVFAASQPLNTAKASCKDPTGAFCTPLARQLAPGGVLFTLTVTRNPVVLAKAHPAAGGVTPTAVSKSCRVAGGTEQLYVLMRASRQPAPAMALSGWVCLARPTDAQRQTARDVVTTAAFT